MTHHACGPSKLALREACPGSLGLHRSLFGDVTSGDEPGSPDQERGRMLHKRMEQTAGHGVPQVQDLDDEDAAAVAWCWERVEAAVSSVLRAGGLVLVEQSVEWEGITGTVDLALVMPGATFALVDYKFGRRWRDPTRQLQAYGCALADMYGCVAGAAEALWPALDHVDTVPLSTHHLPQARAELHHIIARTNASDAPLQPGEHCDYCACKPKCPARAQVAMSVMDARPISPVQTIAALPREQRLHYYERLKLARAWIDGALAMIDDAILGKHLDVAGLTVGEGRQTRMWVDEVAAGKALTAELGDKAHTRELISPAQAEKLLGKQKAKALLANLIHTRPGKPRVCRDGTLGALGDE